jgi:hypothetical protein
MEASSVRNTVSSRDARERNIKTALFLIGVMVFLIGVSIVTILIKN